MSTKLGPFQKDMQNCFPTVLFFRGHSLDFGLYTCDIFVGSSQLSQWIIYLLPTWKIATLVKWLGKYYHPMEHLGITLALPWGMDDPSKSKRLITLSVFCFNFFDVGGICEYVKSLESNKCLSTWPKVSNEDRKKLIRWWFERFVLFSCSDSFSWKDCTFWLHYLTKGCWTIGKKKTISFTMIYIYIMYLYIYTFKLYLWR